MALVNYSDSDDEPPATKKRRLSYDQELPPLPASFRDLYSSTVRVSNSDDPSLHGGRKRAIPHVEGNWNIHVYLEWAPSSLESTLLDSLIAAVQSSCSNSSVPVHSLLRDSLSVPLPLHISLSAPIVQRTETKDAFLEAMSSSLRGAIKSGRSSITVNPIRLAWHANEDGTRAFLVLRVSKPVGDEGGLTGLLQASNGIAQKFGCPTLYAKERKSTEDVRKRQTKAHGPYQGDRQDTDPSECFHISLAWSLGVGGFMSETELAEDPKIEALMQEVRGISFSFSEVKIRSGKDVTTVPFGGTKHSSKGILG